jgi:hypothetical protein
MTDARADPDRPELRARMRWVLLPAAIGVASRFYSIALVLLVNQVSRRRGPDPLGVWDGGWYARIASTGYHAQPLGYHPTTGAAWHDFAFFPSWPGLIRLGSSVASPLGAPEITVGVILANILFVLAAIVIWRVLADRLGPTTATAGTALLAFAPPAYVFSMAYSESLFALLAAMSFLAVRSLWRGPIGLAASLTRALGLAIVVSAALEVLLSHGRTRRAAVAAVIGGALGFAAWWTYVAILTGNPMGYLEGTPGWTADPGLGQFVHVFTKPSFQQAAWVAYLVVVVISAVLLVRRERELGVFVIATLAIGLLTWTAMHSMPRYTLAAFPVFAGLGARLNRRGVVIMVVLFALGQVLFTAWTIPPHNISP